MEEVQLDLFSWDRVKIADAYRSMGSFQLEEAKVAFDAVRTQCPEHEEARQGLRIVSDWELLLHDLTDLTGRDGLVRLWHTIEGYAFGPGDGALRFRQALLERLAARMEDDSVLYVSPDLYLGYVLLEAGDHHRAELSLVRLLREFPGSGKLWSYLGNALWMQGKSHEARIAYTKALLVDPTDVSLDEVNDSELVEIVKEDGIDPAPIRGWLMGVLPLLDAETEIARLTEGNEALAGSKRFRTYTCLARAEKARQRGHHDEMVSHRKILKTEAPEIFDAYMQYLDGFLV